MKLVFSMMVDVLVGSVVLALPFGVVYLCCIHPAILLVPAVMIVGGIGYTFRN